MSPVDYDALKGRLKNQKGGVGWKPKAGENLIRVLYPSRVYLPGKLGEGRVLDRISLPFKSHFLPGEILGRDKVEVFRCPRDKDEECPVCDFFWAHRKSEDPAVAAVAKECNNSLRYLYNVLDLNDPDAGIQPFESGPKIRNALLSFAADERYGDCLSPGPEGRNFIVILTPNGADGNKTGFNQYEVKPDPEKSSVMDKLADGWWEQLDGLEDYVAKEKSEAELIELVDQIKIRLDMEPSSARATKSAPAPKAESEKTADSEEGEEGPEESEKDDASTAGPPEPEEMEDSGEADAEEDSDGHGPDCECDACEVNRLFS